MRTVVKFIASIALPFILGACMAKDSPAVAKTTATLTGVEGRHFSSLSVHPDSEELLFLEFKPDLPEVSRLLRYHLKTKQLSYYDLPKEYVTLDAAFSPSGKYIVMRRAPNIRGDEDVKREAYASSEIVMMRADGTDLKVIPLSKGLKMAPVMSHDDKKIAYWRATQRPDGSKSFAFRFDVWEVDLKTGQDKLFAGSYEFFEGGQLQYLNNDERLLLNGDLPSSSKMPGRDPNNLSDWIYEYQKKYNNSSVYVLERGVVQLSKPELTDIPYGGHVSMDVKSNLYFRGFRPGAAFFKKNIINDIVTQWDYPWGTLGEDKEVRVLPNGAAIAFIFLYTESPLWDYTRRGIAVLDIPSETWKQLDIPLFESATLVTKLAPR